MSEVPDEGGRDSEPPQAPGAPDAQRLGRYELVYKLASGGMASVFLARATGAAGFEKLVALKRIHPHLAEERDFVEMFLDEARIASRIQHANVCTVFDFGEADGTFYLAMEFLVGEPLSRVMKSVAKSKEHIRNPRMPLYVARCIADACEGLHAAHELRGRDGQPLNVVHRDISPHNLFITYDGNVKVVDFGIASATDRVHHTAGGKVKGKFSYMAPEQARGKAVDRRADVWALGVVLWEMLTLKRLFRREAHAETIFALMNDPIPRPSQIRSTVPPALDEIVLKALARNPDERYATARELGRDLVRFLGKTGDPIGMADLADWMEQLLPESKERIRRQVEHAQRGDDHDTQFTPLPMGAQSESSIHAVDSMSPPASPAAPARRSKAPAPLGDTLSEEPAVPPPPALPRGAGASGRQRAISAAAAEQELRANEVPSQRAIRTGKQVAQTEPAMTLPAASPKRSPVVPIIAVLVVLAIGAGVAIAFVAGGGDAQTSGAVATAPTAHDLAGAGAIAPSPPPTPPSAADPTLVDQGIDQGQAAAPDEGPADPTATPTGAENDPTPSGRRRVKRGGRGDERTTGPAPGGDRTPQTGGGGAQPPPATGEATTGTVAIVTPGGWANVNDARGRFLGQTPIRTTLPAGPQTLSIRPYGQPPGARVQVNVIAGQTTRVVHPVAPQ